jgi:hypothetical protein
VLFRGARPLLGRVSFEEVAVRDADGPAVVGPRHSAELRPPKGREYWSFNNAREPMGQLAMGPQAVEDPGEEGLDRYPDGAAGGDDAEQDGSSSGTIGQRLS